MLSNFVAITLFIQLFYVVKCIEEQPKEPWIDPYDMGFSDTPNKKNDVTDISKEAVVPCQPTIDPFLKRHVHRIIRELNIREDTKHVNVDIHVTLTTVDIMSLKTFVQFDVTNSPASEKLRVLHSLDTSLENMLKHVENFETDHEQLSNDRSIITTVIFWLESHFDIIPLIIALVLTFCLWRGMPMWKLGVSILVISCGWEWSLMYKKVLAKKFEMMVRDGGEIPPYCSPDAKSFLQRLFPGVFSNDKDCIRYQEALTVNAYLDVNPAMAVLKTFSKLLLQPLGHLGEKLGIFFNEVLSSNTYLALPAVAFFSGFLAINCHNCDFGWI